MSINKTDGSSSSKDGVTANVRSKINSWQPQFASSLLSGIKIIRKAQPKQPPRGLISSFLVLLMTIGIIMTLTGIKCLEIKALSTASEGATSITPCSEGDNTDSESASCFSDQITTKISNTLSDFSMASQAHLPMATRSNSTRRFILIPIQSSLSATIRQLATFAMTFANLFQACFVKPTKVLLPRMEQVHAFKREQFGFILTTMMDKNTSLSLTTAYIILIHW